MASNKYVCFKCMRQVVSNHPNCDKCGDPTKELSYRTTIPKNGKKSKWKDLETWLSNVKHWRDKEAYWNFWDGTNTGNIGLPEEQKTKQKEFPLRRWR